MAAPKRSKFQIEEERVKITSWYLRGWTQAKIGRELGLSPSMIGHEIKIIQKRWRDDTTFDLDLHKRKTLAEIEEVKKEAWEGFEKSKLEFKSQTAVIQTKKSKKKDPETGQIVEVREQVPVSQTIHTETRIGDPRFLDQVNKAIEQRRKLLGLDKLPDQPPVQHDQFDHINSLSPDQAVDRLNEMIIALQTMASQKQTEAEVLKQKQS